MSEEIACGSIIHHEEDLEYGLHISAIFILLSVSLLGALLPVLGARIAYLRNIMPIIRFLNSIGVGVIISTSLVHMLPPGIEALNDPCLGLNYSNLAIVITVGTLLAMQIVETEMIVWLSPVDRPTDLVSSYFEGPIISPMNSPSICLDETLSKPNHIPDHHHHHQPSNIQGRSPFVRQLNVFLFECSVAIHSIIIGIEMGVATGDTFHTLLIAICFHQFFEGVAIGTSSQGAFTQFRTSILMAFGYAITTPIGILIGILLSDTYSSTTTTSLWVRGILHAVAAGILLYTGIVELLTYQFTINNEFHLKNPQERWMHYGFVILGGMIMSIIGYWV